MSADTHFDRLLDLALDEDIGPGDVTSLLIPAEQGGEAGFLAKENFVVSGIKVATRTFQRVDPEMKLSFEVEDGEPISQGRVFGRVSGPARSILSAERIALNFLQRLSGVATKTRLAVNATKGTKAKIIDTRKTTPGFRALEKAAVRHGGGQNHRQGLFDGVLIKDNHIEAVGSVEAAIRAARTRAHHLLAIECEVRTLEELREAVDAGANVILLDNMNLDELRAAVGEAGGAVLLEASGGVTLDRIPEIAATGVDFISMGALTHSAPSVDISLDWNA